MFPLNSVPQDLDLIHQQDKVLDRASIGSVVLPIPGGISDQNKCDWGSSSMQLLWILQKQILLNLQYLMVLVKVLKQDLERLKKLFDQKDESSTAIGMAIAAQVSGVDKLFQEPLVMSLTPTWNSCSRVLH